MRFAHALSAFAALSMLAAGGAHAQQKSQQQSKPMCRCACNTSAGVQDGVYDKVAACSAYDGKACSYLGKDNLLHTGSLVGCVDESGGGVASTSTAGVYTPPTKKPPRVAPPVSERPAAVAK